MKKPDIFIMTQREIKRLGIIKQVIEKELTQKIAGEILGISDRQVRRIIKRVKYEGDGGVIHQSRSRESTRKIDDRLKKKVINVYEKKYWDFGPTFACEKLLDNEGIKISRETLRQWLIAEGMYSRKRKVRKHRSKRGRKECFGQMVQIDGSHHDWLEDRGPRLVLMGYIDDATSRVYGRFYEYEGTIPAMESLKGYIKKYGKPQSVYVDRHTTYKSPDRDKWRAISFGKESLSQFERACKELEIVVIHAYSPQAKGRVERLFKTLQDRLVKELRLLGVDSLEGANQYLETYLKKHNQKFQVDPVSKANLHQKVRQAEVSDALSVKTLRRVRNDFTIAHNHRIYQIKEYTRDIDVEVREKLNGTMEIWDKRKKLKYRALKPVNRIKNSSIKNRTFSFCTK